MLDSSFSDGMADDVSDKLDGVNVLEPRVVYRTGLGMMIEGNAEDVLNSHLLRPYCGQTQLIFTSPPFPLNRKKKYGNRTGQDYIEWLADLAMPLVRYLKNNGSIAIELGNSWEPGKPSMSTLALRALLTFQERGKLELCQQFVCSNRAKLPSPAQWVNVERIRVKDAFTHVWWMSPTDRPKANNRRVLVPYSSAMKNLLETQKYNAGKRPSEHSIGEKSFLNDNGGAIPSNVIEVTNTHATDTYLRYCKMNDITPHPARMPMKLAEFFIEFLTEPGDLVIDPFGGSNVTGAAAESLNRRWISIESEPKYAEASMARFPNAVTGAVQ